MSYSGSVPEDTNPDIAHGLPTPAFPICNTGAVEIAMAKHMVEEHLMSPQAQEWLLDVVAGPPHTNPITGEKITDGSGEVIRNHELGLRNMLSNGGVKASLSEDQIQRLTKESQRVSKPLLVFYASMFGSVVTLLIAVLNNGG